MFFDPMMISAIETGVHFYVIYIPNDRHATTFRWCQFCGVSELRISGGINCDTTLRIRINAFMSGVAFEHQ